jgi:LysM repeat protein
MKRSTLLTFIQLIFILFCSGNVHSQVVVERSKTKAVISGKVYYIHIVKKGETAYSISRAYGITVDQLVRENPSAAPGIKEGQSLRLPVVEDVAGAETVASGDQVHGKQRNDTLFIYHKLTTGDTVFSLAKRYGVSEDEIIESNPGVEIFKLPVGTEIAIPRRQFTISSQNLEPPDEGYILHKVRRGESVASIASQYGLTAREVRRENRGLIFPKVDDFIKIPVHKIPGVEGIVGLADTTGLTIADTMLRGERPVEYTPVGELRGTYNVALLLPLYLKQNSDRIEIDSSTVVKGKKIYKASNKPDQWIFSGSIPFLELYEGVLLAADTLRSLGLNINLYVYDIKQDTIETHNLIESGELSDMDLIIGPVYSNNLSEIARFADYHNIPVVSPVPLKSNKSLDNNPTLFMVNPSLEVAQEKIAARIGRFSNSNFVFIHSDSTYAQTGVSEFKNVVIRELSSKIPYEDIKFKEFVFYSRSVFGVDSINRLEHAMSDNAENLVLIASEDPPVLSEIISDLHTLSKKFDIRLIGYPVIRDLINLDPKYYFDLGIELYTPYWIDYSKRNVINFNKKFYAKFKTQPSEVSFAWQGYDIAYYFLSGLAMHGRRFMRHPEIHNPELLETEFDFYRKDDDNDNGFENHKLYLIKYTGDMDIKLLNDSVVYQYNDF